MNNNPVQTILTLTPDRLIDWRVCEAIVHFFRWWNGDGLVVNNEIKTAAQRAHRQLLIDALGGGNSQVSLLHNSLVDAYFIEGADNIIVLRDLNGLVSFNELDIQVRLDHCEGGALRELIGDKYLFDVDDAHIDDVRTVAARAEFMKYNLPPALNRWVREGARCSRG